jgi:hypothetical protein
VRQERFLAGVRLEARSPQTVFPPAGAQRCRVVLMVAMGDPPRALRSSHLRVPWARRELNPHIGRESSTVGVTIALSFVVSLAVPLTACGGGGQPAAAPVAGKIAFVTWRDGNDEIYVMSADGAEQINLTSNPAHDFDPAWFPDGSKMIFTSTRDGNNDIHVMNADGTGQTNLTGNPAADQRSTWSLDGSWIAFESNRDGNFEVHIMNADGSGQTQITTDPAGAVAPTWTP